MWRTLAGALLIAGCATPDSPSPASGLAADAGIDGCWVHIFGRQGYRPPVRTYTGPTGERFYAGPAGSIIVGPAARLLTYSPDNLDTAEDGVLPPGARVPNFPATDMYGELHSFNLECVSRDVNPSVVRWRR